MKKARVCGFDMVVPDHVADWEEVQGDSQWEHARIHSILDTLKWGDVLYDIGAEHGWMSAIYASRVGGHNMVLVEPTLEFWPNIRRCWEENNLITPIACVPAFCADTDGGPIVIRDWPRESIGSEAPAQAYAPMTDDYCPSLTIDRIVMATQAVPRGITIDVEGQEMNVLYGASRVLWSERPEVWVSIHEDMLDTFGIKVVTLFEYMDNMGYYPVELGTDHERHVHFTPRKR